MVIESLLGSVLGGVFRLAPEGIKAFEAKGERKHELAMFDKQLEADKIRVQLANSVEQTRAQIVLDTNALDVFKASIQSQTDMAKDAGGVAAKWSAMVRPITTYWLLVLYAAAKSFHFIAAIQSGQDLSMVASTVYGPEDMALLSSVMSFWFLDRVIKKHPNFK